MNNIKKTNLLFCLVLSFVFLFGGVFSVEASEVINETQLIEEYINKEEYPGEIIGCEVSYTAQHIRNGCEKKIIWEIQPPKFSIVKCPWYMWNELYRFDNVNVKISADRTSAKIFVSVYRKSGIFLDEKKFDLTFDLNLN